ncbi:glycoside hydrolase family 32 protein [Ruminococcus sp. OA3]|uniref:glycoside hydrolase family 32 protein n=1 Tax=Ruminococcus sp. OA3 TaxID=2914164 RepID=UPI001F06BE5C|nr:glycoside hydrolase family 32 protein [Ruminococcus sp. OA3]MCH1981400.1 glycoside hydrolase family 32 protein [Ruminococcus sp. OA3]
MKKTEILTQITEAETASLHISDEKYRLFFHLMPPVGWLNDPNGLCVYRDTFHVFFQYSPEAPDGSGRKVWGHYTSADLVNWRYQGTPLVTDTVWDRDGAYSGCAFTDDGNLEVFYTGNVKETGDFDYIFNGRQANIIYTVSKDGTVFDEKLPLLTNRDYPSSYTCHVRDPKVWKQGGQYYMVLGGRKKDEHGAVMVYTSPDKKDWSLLKEMTSVEPFGYMWECPDLFEMNSRWFLLCCPQGLPSEAERYQNLYQSGYFQCEGFTLEDTDYKCHPGAFWELDHGFDFYAPQTFTDSGGRRILIGWAGIPEEERYGNAPTINEGWQHALTVPRELTFDGNMLRQYPVQELDSLHGEGLSLEENVIRAAAFDMQLTLAGNRQSVRLDDDLVLDCTDGLVTLTFLNDTGAGRTCRTARLPKGQRGIKELRILKDTSMLEFYINHGELVFTTRYYPKDVTQTPFALTGTVCRLHLWKIQKMNVHMGNLLTEYDMQKL